MTREAEMKARDFVALVIGGIHGETEVGVAQRLLLQAQTALNCYADPEWAAEFGWPAFGDALLDRARESAPGSDHQLAFVNALCTSVLAPNHIAVLSTLLDNEPAAVNLAGLVIDTDLRWRIVTALAAAGVIDADGTETPFIDAEADRDPTAAGKRNAAAAAAARPQVTVKNAAWQRVIEDDTWPTSPPAPSSAASRSPGRPTCSHASGTCTSRPFRASGNAGPVRSRRRS